MPLCLPRSSMQQGRGAQQGTGICPPSAFREERRCQSPVLGRCGVVLGCGNVCQAFGQ